MIIIHRLDDFTFELFPKLKGLLRDTESLKNEIVDFYTFGPYRPQVDIENSIATINIDEVKIANEKKDFDKVVALCEKRKYDLAKPILGKLIKNNPTISEYHRILGQIYSDEGDQEKAINFLVDALKWDPRSTYALLMMGNIFARFKDDIKTAMKYYDQVLSVNPKDGIALNNIGANLLQLEKMEEAKRYFELAYEINPNYPNTTYAFGLMASNKGDYLKAFEFGIQSVKNAKTHEPVYKHAVGLINESVIGYTKANNAKAVIEKYLQRIEKESPKKIQITEDDSIPTAAKIELAENHNRDSHYIKYKANYPAYEHLVMHELVHLDFFLQARNAAEGGKNKLFITRNDHKELFIRDNEQTLKKLEQLSYPDKVISDFISSLFSGLTQQIFNAPIDLFIEEFLFNEFPELKPHQFISLTKLLNEGITAVTKKEIVDLTPGQTLNASKIMNLVTAMHFKDLFGIDYTQNYKASASQTKKALQLYKQFLDVKAIRTPASEYNLVEAWSKELNLGKYFELVDENEYRTRSNLDDIIKDIEENPFGLNKPMPADAQKEPLSFEKEPAGQMAVTMYCLSALQLFEKKTKEEIKEIGFEIALLGSQGIDPKNSEKRHNLASIPGKQFSGLQLLAYMYVAWQQIDPTKDLEINFKNEYEQAKKMFYKK